MHDRQHQSSASPLTRAPSVLPPVTGLTYLKVRQLPKIGATEPAWAVCHFPRREDEPYGNHWPHLIRTASKASALSCAEIFARNNPRYVLVP